MGGGAAKKGPKHPLKPEAGRKVPSFSSGLCDTGAVGTAGCALAFFCCPCSVAKAYDAAKHGTEHTGCCPCGTRPNCCCHDPYAFFCTIGTLGVGAWCVLCKTRAKTRARFDIQRSANCCHCSDACVVAFCPCCSLMQVQNQLISQGIPARLGMTEYDLPSRHNAAADAAASAPSAAAAAAPLPSPALPSEPSRQVIAPTEHNSSMALDRDGDLNEQFHASAHDLSTFRSVASPPVRRQKKDWSVVFK